MATHNVTDTKAEAEELDPSLLPIEQVSMPEEDVSDLRDVVDAINKLCETMKTSYDEYEDCEDVHEADVDTESVELNEVLFEKVHAYGAEKWCDTERGATSPERVEVNLDPGDVVMFVDNNYSVTEPSVTVPEIIKPVPIKFETCKIDRFNMFKESAVACSSEQVTEVPENVEALQSLGSSWGEMVIEPVASTFEPVFEKVRSYKSDRSDAIELKKPVVATDIEVARTIVTERFEEIPSDVETVQCEPMSEMYYTASSEVSLLSDVDFQDKAQTEDSDKERDDRNSVITGHVAAMRERFESMTRTNTPCPDLIRSTSPSFEVFRNVSTTPDTLE